MTDASRLATLTRWSRAFLDHVLSPAIISGTISIYPALIVTNWLPYSTLDWLPYLICWGAGVAVAIVALRTRLVGCFISLVIWGGPFWGVALGIAGNALFDRSPSVRHETVFLGEIHGKGPAAERFASWREAGHEERLKCPIINSRALCFGLALGQAVVVTTRSGAFGWEWWESVTAR